MFRKPYHLCPPNHPERCGPESDPKKKIWLNQNSMVGNTLLHFFTDMEWGDWAESVPFMRDEDEKSKKKKGGPEMSISKVSTNYTYPNVFGLRQHKLNIMKQIIEAVPRNVKFVHLKELERSPETFIQSLVKEFNLEIKDGYKPQPASKVAHPTVCLTPAEWDAAEKNIDWSLEAEFGFSPFDCRMCYGYEKSTRLYDRIQRGKKVKKILDGDEQKQKKQKGKNKQKDKEEKTKQFSKQLKKQKGRRVANQEKQGMDAVAE